MKGKAIGILTALGVAVGTVIYSVAFGDSQTSGQVPAGSQPAEGAKFDLSKPIYQFTMNSIDGKPVKLESFMGKVMVVVNTASRCGLTPQYEGLERLYRSHKDRGLVVLGFPANNFMNQEPGTDAEIKEFCTTRFDVTFPMFSKISVKGSDTHPLYQWLLSSTDNNQDIEWNFAKFVVGRDGKVVARFSPRTQPDDPKFLETIEKALASK
mgnify:CR=1 FL=1